MPDGDFRLTRDYSTFAGPSDDEIREGHRLYRRRRGFLCTPSEGSYYLRKKGTPRKVKHRGYKINGVTIR